MLGLSELHSVVTKNKCQEVRNVEGTKIINATRWSARSAESAAETTGREEALKVGLNLMRPLSASDSCGEIVAGTNAELVGD